MDFFVKMYFKPVYVNKAVVRYDRKLVSQAVGNGYREGLSVSPP